MSDQKLRKFWNIGTDFKVIEYEDYIWKMRTFLQIYIENRKIKYSNFWSILEVLAISHSFVAPFKKRKKNESFSSVATSVSTAILRMLIICGRNHWPWTNYYILSAQSLFHHSNQQLLQFYFFRTKQQHEGTYTFSIILTHHHNYLVGKIMSYDSTKFSHQSNHLYIHWWF